MLNQKHHFWWVMGAGIGVGALLFGRADWEKVVGAGTAIVCMLMAASIEYQRYLDNKPAINIRCPRCRAEWRWCGVGENVTGAQASCILKGEGCPNCQSPSVLKPTVNERELMVLTQSASVEEMYQKLNEPPNPAWVKMQQTEEDQEFLAEENHEFLEDYVLEREDIESPVRPDGESQTGTATADLQPSPILDASGIPFRASLGSDGADQHRSMVKPVGKRVLVSEEEYRAALERIKARQKREPPSGAQ